jgi:transposase
LAKRKDIDLWCEDECHFQQHGSRCAMWIPPENLDPVVLHAPTRKQMAVFGAVCPADGRMVTMPAETFDTQRFQAFLGRLLRRRRHGCKMVIVLDNARWHHARALRPWLHKHRHVLRLDFLPPYSPDLNPVERVWKLTRRLCTHNVYFQTLQNLVSVVQIQFAKWLQPNLQLHRLCAII